MLGIKEMRVIEMLFSISVTVPSSDYDSDETYVVGVIEAPNSDEAAKRLGAKIGAGGERRWILEKPEGLQDGFFAIEKVSMVEDPTDLVSLYWMAKSHQDDWDPPVDHDDKADSDK